MFDGKDIKDLNVCSWDTWIQRQTLLASNRVMKDG